MKLLCALSALLVATTVFANPTSEETIAQKAQNLKTIEQSFKQELSNYLLGRFGKFASLRMAGDSLDPYGYDDAFSKRMPDDVIAILLDAKDVGSFTETQLSAFAREIGLYYLIKNPYLDSCQIEIYPDLFVNEWARITHVARHQGMEKQFADSYKILEK